MKRARGHASGHPRMSFCVVNVTLLESCVYVLPARGRTVGGACPPSPLSAYPDPLRHARRPGKSGTVVAGPPSARCARRLSTFRIRLFALADSYRSVLVRQGSTERYRLTVRSGRRPCDAAGGALMLRLLRALRRYSFSTTRAWPAVGSAGTRRILSSKTVTFAGFFGSRRGPRSRGAGESSRGAVRVTFRLRFVTGESPDLACTLVAAAQRTTLL
jgi:hypothetical protein